MLVALTLVPEVVLQACSIAATEPTGAETHFPLVYGDRPSVCELSALGRRLFFDVDLSASGRYPEKRLWAP